MKRYTVCVDRTSTDEGKVGQFVAKLYTSHHTSAAAAKRRLGSLIAGKLKSVTAGSVRVYAIDNVLLKTRSWTDLRNLTEDGAL